MRSPFRFEGAIRQAIHQLKYRNLRALATPLAEIMGDYLASADVPGDVLVPVPLHRRKLRERGYNQSGLLARKLGKTAGLPVVEDCLARVRPTPPQAKTSSVDERRHNVAGVFGCGDGRMKGRQVLLVDDVATSGATLDACAVAMKEAGAATVWGLTVAREI